MGLARRYSGDNLGLTLADIHGLICEADYMEVVQLLTIKDLRGLLGAWLLILSSGALSAIDYTTANVTEVLRRSDGALGGCMAMVDALPAGTNCGVAPRYISFSCTGLYTSKAEGSAMYEQAQLAFVAGKKLKFFVTDAQKHDTYCFAYDARVVNP